MLIKLHITLLAESMLMCIIVRSICRSPSMADTSFSFRKHRRLPGQSELGESTWADLDGADDDHYWAEVRAVDLDRRRAEVKVAENFKALRLRLDLTQTDMAQRLGLSLRSLQMYERGERPISSDILADLYVQFDIDLQRPFKSDTALLRESRGQGEPIEPRNQPPQVFIDRRRPPDDPFIREIHASPP